MKWMLMYAAVGTCAGVRGYQSRFFVMSVLLKYLMEPVNNILNGSDNGEELIKHRTSYNK